jgi:hypothetical protein
MSTTATNVTTNNNIETVAFPHRNARLALLVRICHCMA